MDIIQTNKQFIDNVVNSKDFTDKIEEAVPYRVKIDVDLRNEMKNIRKLFLIEKFKSDEKFQQILEKKKKNWTDDERIYVKNKIKQSNREFKSVKNIICPNNSTPDEAAKKLVDKIIDIAKILKYIGKDYLPVAFANAGIKIEIPDLKDENNYFANNSSREIMTDIFNQADKIQCEIYKASNEIKDNIFDKLPNNIKFDKTNNKKGIRKGVFQKLVKTKAITIEKDNDKVQKFKEFRIKDVESQIISKQIEVEKTKMI